MGRDISQAELYVVAPTGERVRFAIRARWNRGRSDQVTETLKLPEIDSTNRLYRTGKISREEAHAALTKLAKRLGGKTKPDKQTYCTANLKVLNAYFEKVYGSREIKDRKAAYSRLLRAIKALGDLRLSTASPNEIFEAVRRYQPNQQRRKTLFAALGQLLKHIGRTDVAIPRIRKARPKIRHLTMSEFRQVVAHIPDSNFALLCSALFATGCRPGELFALTPSCLRPHGQSVYVAESVDRETGEIGPTKTGGQREAVIIEAMAKEVRDWVNLLPSVKQAMRSKPHSKWFRKAVRQAFPNDQDKWSTVFYDLRHSYAIHCLNAGVPIKLVAQSLGNSGAVCEEFYSGYNLTEAGVSAMARILAGNS